MSTRADLQPELGLANKLAYLRTTINDLRQAQTFGSSNVRTYRLFNGSTNAEITLLNVTTTTSRCVEVTLTPDIPSLNPVIAYDFAVSVGSSGTTGIFYHYEPLPPVNGIQKFRVYVLNQSATTDLWMAFNFWTISHGTYTFQEITV